MRLGGVKKLLTEPVLLEQMAKVRKRCLVGYPVTDLFDAGKAAHGGHLNQSHFHGRIAEGIPLLQKVDAHHGRQ